MRKAAPIGDRCTSHIEKTMSRIDWNLARAFCMTADTGSLSAAARKLGLTQPTLSRQVADFEAALGVTVFERVGKRLVLTESGLSLLEHARAMSTAAEAMALAAVGRAQDIGGTVKISATDAVSAYLLPEIIETIRQKAPRGIQVRRHGADQSADQLVFGRLHMPDRDIGFASSDIAECVRCDNSDSDLAVRRALERDRYFGQRRSFPHRLGERGRVVGDGAARAWRQHYVARDRRENARLGKTAPTVAGCFCASLACDSPRIANKCTRTIGVRCSRRRTQAHLHDRQRRWHMILRLRARRVANGWRADPIGTFDDRSVWVTCGLARRSGSVRSAPDRNRSPDQQRRSTR